MKLLLVALRDLIASDAVINERLFESVDLVSALDQRDTDVFEADWLRVFHEVEARRKEMPLSPEFLGLVDEIRELAYKRTFRITQHPEVCAAVSEDLGLVATALASGYEDGWLRSLWLTYTVGAFPQTSIEPNGGSLAEAVRSALRA